MIEFRKLSEALRPYCSPDANIQAATHVKPFHYYSSIRLVLEGGFEPENILPRPPLSSTKKNYQHYILKYEQEKIQMSEATVLGGFRSKQLDVTVRNIEAGPILGISFKTTNNAFRNLPNRFEEFLGDVTNIHLRYPAFIYGFCHIIKMVREGEVRDRNDASFTDGLHPVASVQHIHDLLVNLMGRKRISDSPEFYESIAFLVVECSPEGGRIFPNFPPPDSPVHLSHFFERLYKIYDERFCYIGANPIYNRRCWSMARDVQTRDINLNSQIDGGEIFPYNIRLWG